jgi:hypothetical protein
MTQHGVLDMAKNFPTDSRIWRSFKSKNIAYKLRNIMCVETAHNASKCGNYWLNIKNWEQCATCQKCQTTESMEHILSDRKDSAQEIIWRPAEGLWSKKGIPWPKPTFGTQLGCGMPGGKG